jgi:hypothetical protein
MNVSRVTGSRRWTISVTVGVVIVVLISETPPGDLYSTTAH